MLNVLHPIYLIQASRRMSRILGQPYAPVTIAFLITAVLIYWPQISHPTDVLVGIQRDGRNDLTSHFLGNRAFPRIAWTRGNWPLWNPWILLGQPYVGNPQTAVWYPPNWLMHVLDHPATASWLQVLHMIWGALGTYVYARTIGCRREASLVAGVVFMGAPYCIAQLGEGHYNQVCQAGWFPWIFLGYEGWRGGQIWGPLIFVFSFFLAVCCGHIQEVYYCGMLLFLTTLISAFRRWFSSPRLAVKQFFSFLGLMLLVAGLSALEVLPIMAYLRQAVRGTKLDLHAVTAFGFSSNHLWLLLDPWVTGGPAHSHGLELLWEKMLHFGVIPLLWALPSITHVRQSSAVGRVFGWFIFCVLFAFGPTTPLYSLFHEYFPGIALFRAPSRILFLGSVFLAVLAGAGLDRWLHQHHSSMRQAGLWFLVILCLAMAGLVACHPLPLPYPANLVLSKPRLWLLTAMACSPGVLLNSLFFRRVQSLRWIVWLLPAAELSILSNNCLVTVPAEYYRRGSMLTNFFENLPTSDATRWGRVLVEQELLSDDEAQRFKICKLNGYEPAPLTRTLSMLARRVATERLADLTLGFVPMHPSDWNMESLEALGIHWLVSRTLLSDNPDWELVATGRIPASVTLRGRSVIYHSVYLYRYRRPFPRAWVVGKATRYPHQSSPVRAEIENPRESVLLSQDPLPAGERASFHPVSIWEYSDSRVVLEVDLEAPGYVVLSDIWCPGWQASVDDGPAQEVLCAHDGFRAVPVLAGKHRIVIWYRPPLLIHGMLLSFLTLSAACILVTRYTARNIAPQHIQDATN